MKRTLSLLLSLVLIFTVISNINLIVDAVNIDFEIQPSDKKLTLTGGEGTDGGTYELNKVSQ